MPPHDFFTLPSNITPLEFEKLVYDWLKKSFSNLEAFEAKHRERMKGLSGEFEIDVLVRFTALNVNFITLIECKHLKRPVEREAVQILHDRIRETGAQKGMLITTSSFQSGAVQYGSLHGIALVKVADGETCYVTKSFDGPKTPPEWANIPQYVGWIHLPKNTFQIVEQNDVRYFRDVILDVKSVS